MIFLRKNNVELEYQTATLFDTKQPVQEEMHSAMEPDDDDDIFDDEPIVKERTDQEYLWYVIDLTNRQLYGVKDNHERVELEWQPDVDTFIQEAKEDCIHTLKLRIENNRNVIYTSTSRNDQVELEKAKAHMERNFWLIDFITNYKN